MPTLFQQTTQDVDDAVEAFKNWQQNRTNLNILQQHEQLQAIQSKVEGETASRVQKFVKTANETDPEKKIYGQKMCDSIKVLQEKHSGIVESLKTVAPSVVEEFEKFQQVKAEALAKEKREREQAEAEELKRKQLEAEAQKQQQLEELRRKSEQDALEAERRRAADVQRKADEEKHQQALEAQRVQEVRFMVALVSPKACTLDSLV